MLLIHWGRWAYPFHDAQKLVSASRAEGRPVTVLVPQQYTLLTETTLIRLTGSMGFFDVDVMTPARLSQKIFARCGGDDRVLIDERGKAMAVSRALNNKKKDLAYYMNAVGRQGLTDSVSRVIADVKRAGLSAADLSAYGESLSDDAGRAKYGDLALLYARYEEMLSGRFVDGEDVQREMIARLPAADFLKGTDVIVLGFDLITHDLAQTLAALARYVNAVHVYLCADREDPAYAPANESLLDLEALCRAEGVEVRYTPLMPLKDMPEDIAFIGRHLLAGRFEKWPAVPGNVTLYTAPTPYAEACRAAEEIARLRMKGVPLKDVLVLYGQEENYAAAVDHALTIYNIPHQLTRKASAGRIGAGRFLLDALAALNSRFAPDDMRRLLKNDCLPLSDDERYRLENLIVACGIRGSMFEKPFTRGGEEGVRLEEARLRLMEPLLALKDGLRRAQDVDEALTAVMALLTAVDAYGHMEGTAEKLEAAGLYSSAAQLRQVWKSLMNLMDQLHEIVGGDRLGAEELEQMLEAGLTGTQISALPQDMNAVPCGPIGGIAPGRPDHLFILGLNDGILNTGEEGLIAPEEQKDLETRFRVRLSLDEDGKSQLKRLEVQKAMTAGRTHLYLSHALSLQDGTALRPLDLLSRVRRLFPALVAEGGASAPQGPARPYAALPIMEAMAAHLRDGAPDGEWAEAWRYLSARRPQDARTLSDAFLPPDRVRPLSEAAAHRLFMERVTSVNRLESFAVCPFRHFVMYGLRPGKRGEFRMTGADTGSFYHRALEGFERLLPTLPGWPDEVTEAQVRQLMLKAADGALDELFHGILADSARERSIYKKYCRTLTRIASFFTRVAKHSAFRMREGDCELRFGYEEGGLPAIPLTLSNGRKVLVRGVIDRVERYENDEGLYFRLIDFKTPDLSLKPEKIFWGAQLQLLIYMLALKNAYPEGTPAGLYYFHVAEPLVTDPDERRDVEELLAKEFCLKGLTLRDADIIRLMDDGQPPVSLPSLLRADGSFGEGKPLAALDHMVQLIDAAGKIAAHLSESILTGDISASPLVFPNEDKPCDKCPARDVCRPDAPFAPVLTRPVERMSFEELIDRVTMER